MISQYGKKKGESVFYAMENSGKLRGVLKAKGGKDASKADFVSHPFAAGQQGALKTVRPPAPTGNGGNNNNQTTKKQGYTYKQKGFYEGPITGPLTLGLSIASKLLTPAKHPFSYNKGPKQATLPTPRDDNKENPQLCPDGTFPPCKMPGTQIKAPAQKNMFLSGFQAYDDGGEVVISSNVDKDLL